MTATLEQLVDLLALKEDEHLEFKEAKNHFDFEKLVKYCAALANEGGGRMILGVTDKRPRRVVGTREFTELERTKAGLVERLRLRIEVDAIEHPEGRVIVFEVPPRHIGFPIQYRGAYWMRGGEDLVPMTQDMLKRVFAETQPDFSAEVCRAATLTDLDPQAIEKFRSKWAEKSKLAHLHDMTVSGLLEDAELTVDGAVTFAAIILLGTRRALGRHLAQAEVVFEYRSEDASIPYQLPNPARGPGVRRETEMRYKVNGSADMTGPPLVRACASPLISSARSTGKGFSPSRRISGTRST